MTENMMLLDAQQRLEKEAHVSGLGGTSYFEVHFIVFITLSNFLLFKMTPSLGHSKNSPLGVQFFVEFLVLIFPCILSLTFMEYSYFFLFLSYSCLFFHMLPSSRFFSHHSDPELSFQQISSSRKPFLDSYRSMMMLFVVVAILAVDFHIFPRRLAKTETFGVSLMDVGVGCFIFSNSIVLSPKFNQFSFKKSFQTSLPLLLLGFFRLFTVSATNYQQHISEYGLHWNFFFTLAFVFFLFSLFSKFVSAKYFSLLGFLLLISHQLALSFGLQDWVINSPRDFQNLISLNKEGIVSLPGYLGLFFLGVSIGNLFFSNSSSSSSFHQWKVSTLSKLFC
eukprot:Sdes_comp8939_c0_seq1m359